MTREESREGLASEAAKVHKLILRAPGRFNRPLLSEKTGLSIERISVLIAYINSEDSGLQNVHYDSLHLGLGYYAMNRSTYYSACVNAAARSNAIMIGRHGANLRNAAAMVMNKGGDTYAGQAMEIIEQTAPVIAVSDLDEFIALFGGEQPFQGL